MPDEVDPYQKPQELLNVSPKGLVPALALNVFNPPRALHESTVILDFLEGCVRSNMQALVKANNHTASPQIPPIVASSHHPQILVGENLNFTGGTYIVVCRCDSSRPSPI